MPNLNPLKQLPNPYTIDHDNMVRVQIYVDPIDKYFLQSVYPIKGVDTFLLAGVFKNVCSELRALGITHFSIDNAHTAYEIIQRHVTPPLPSGTGPILDVPRAGRSVHRKSKTSPDKSTDNG